MEKNPTFISSNGKSFIFSNSKKKILNLYNLQIHYKVRIY